MKKIMKISSLLLAGLALVLITSCSKDDDSNGNDTVYKKPAGSETISKIELPASVQNSDNPYVQMAALNVQMAVGLTQAFSGFDVPDGATETSAKSADGTRVWYWSDGAYSCWMSYWEDANKYYWKYEISMTGISRYTVLTAEEKKDGTGGEVKYYAAANTVALTYNWTLVNNVLTIEMVTPDATLDMVINADGSGTMDWTAGSDNFHMAWNADGSGSINGTSGGETFSYSWTAKK